MNRTGNPDTDRALANQDADRARTGNSQLAKGRLAVPTRYSLVSVVLAPGEAVLVWRGLLASTVTLPLVVGLGAGVTQFVAVHNEGSAAIAVVPNSKDAMFDGAVSVASFVIQPNASALFFGDGAARWALVTPDVGAADQDYRRAQASTSGVETWYYANCNNNGVLVAAVALTAGRMYAMPFLAPRRANSLDRIGVNVAAAVAASNCRLGLYANAGGSNSQYPGALLFDSGDKSTAVIAVVTATLAQVLIPGGLYWAVLHPSAAITVNSLPTARCSHFLGVDATLALQPVCGLYGVQAYGALPATFPAGATPIVADPIPGIATRWAT